MTDTQFNWLMVGITIITIMVILITIVVNSTLWDIKKELEKLNKKMDEKEKKF